MEDSLISFETAKLAKEKGFKGSENSTIHINWSQDCDYKTKISFEPYCFLNGNFYNHYKYSIEKFKNLFTDKKVFTVRVDISTQSLLQKWLREVYDIHVNPNYQYTKSNVSLGYSLSVESGRYKYIGKYIYGTIYEDVLEIGLQEALQLIK